MRFKSIPCAAGALALTASLALAGCGSSAPSGAAHAKASSAAAAHAPVSAESAFASHAGLAFGAFYHFIYAPYRAGEFGATAADRPVLTRATLAAEFVAGQIAQATRAASGNATLSKLVPPLKVLGEGFQAALVRLRSGHFKFAEIEAANVAISAIKGSAINAGTPISESTPSAI